MTADIRMTVDDALARLGAHLGAPDFRLDGNGLIAFDFADGIACTIEVPEDSDAVHLHAAVTRLPASGREAFLTGLLERNLFRLGLNGAWLALDGDEVLVCARVAGGHFDPEALPGLLLALTEEVRMQRGHLDACTDDQHGLASGAHFLRG